MSEKYHYESGAIHNDNHKELNIGSVSEDTLNSLISQFLKDDAVDAEVVEEEKDNVSVQTQSNQQGHEEIGNGVNNFTPKMELHDSRKMILDQLLSLTENGDWVNGITHEDVQKMLTIILGLGDVPLSENEAKLSEKFWGLLENGRGDRVKIIWQNMIGYLDDKGLFKEKGSPALNKDFFGNENNYSNIDKGRPSKNSMSEGFSDVIPLLNKYCPKR